MNALGGPRQIHDLVVRTIHRCHRLQGGREGGPGVSWDKLSTGTNTLVILLGMGNVENLIEQLIKNNKPRSIPVAVITHGTTSTQRCVIGALQDIVKRVKAKNLQPPSVVIVGEVIRFHERLD